MNIAKVFDLLLKNRQFALPLDESVNKEALRVSLIRKLKLYKESMGRIGYLAEDIEKASVSVEVDKEEKVVRFFLRERKTSTIEYNIISIEIEKDS